MTDYITQICSVIRYLHELPSPVLHLDIKPENIIITEGRARLIDFGSAIRSEGNGRCDSMSRGFAAPEQEAGLEAGFSTDVYALGKLLGYMLSHSSADANERKRLAGIAARCCERKPWRRISAAGTMLKMLERPCRRSGWKGAETKEKDPAAGEKAGRGHTGLTIGITGSRPGIGTTHIALAVANYLAEFGNMNVCLAERSDHSDISRIPALIRERAQGAEVPVKLNGVTYLTSGCAYAKEGAACSHFDATVYDLGSNAERAAAVLDRCDIAITVAGAAPWCAADYEGINGSSGRNGENRKRLTFINPADRALMKNIRSCGRRLVPFPYEANPMSPGRETVKILKRAIR